MTTNTVNTRLLRNRIGIVVVIALICSLVVGLFVDMKSISRVRYLAKKHTFYEYVVTHHVGTLEEIDDGTGMVPQSYVLHLNKMVHDEKLQSYTASLMKLYYEYDNGSTLTIMAADPHGGHSEQVAQAHYDDDQGILYMTLSPPNVPVRTIKLSPKW